MAKFFEWVRIKFRIARMRREARKFRQTAEKIRRLSDGNLFRQAEVKENQATILDAVAIQLEFYLQTGDARHLRRAEGLEETRW